MKLYPLTQLIAETYDVSGHIRAISSAGKNVSEYKHHPPHSHHLFR